MKISQICNYHYQDLSDFYRQWLLKISAVSWFKMLIFFILLWLTLKKIYLQNHKSYTARPLKTLQRTISHPCYFWKNIFTWAIYRLCAKYSLKDLNKIVWFFPHFAKWFLFENSYPSFCQNKYYLNIQNGGLQPYFLVWNFCRGAKKSPVTATFWWTYNPFSNGNFEIGNERKWFSDQTPSLLYSPCAVSRCDELFEPFQIWI